MEEEQLFLTKEMLQKLHEQLSEPVKPQRFYIIVTKAEYEHVFKRFGQDFIDGQNIIWTEPPK